MKKYSARTRRTLVSMFEVALANLPDTTSGRNASYGPYASYNRSSPYICDTIQRNTSNYQAANVATDFIAERIGNVFSIDAWLMDQSEEIAEAVQHDVICNNGRKLQAYRKAWLKSLIKEFEA
jgi:hypothetical protein